MWSESKDSVWKAVKKAFDAMPDETVCRIAQCKTQVMMSVIEYKGGNGFKMPHFRRTHKQNLLTFFSERREVHFFLLF